MNERNGMCKEEIREGTRGGYCADEVADEVEYQSEDAPLKAYPVRNQA